MHVHDGAADASVTDAIERVIYEGAALHLDERFRKVISQRAHTFAHAGREHDCGFRAPLSLRLLFCGHYPLISVGCALW